MGYQPIVSGYKLPSANQIKKEIKEYFEKINYRTNFVNADNFPYFHGTSLSCKEKPQCLPCFKQKVLK